MRCDPHPEPMTKCLGTLPRDSVSAPLVGARACFFSSSLLPFHFLSIMRPHMDPLCCHARYYDAFVASA